MDYDNGLETLKMQLEDAIDGELVWLKQLDSGTEQSTKIIEDVERLYKLRLEQERYEREAEERERANRQEEEYKAKVLEQQKKDSFRTAIIRSVEVGGGITLAILGFIYESKGSISSQTMREVFKDVIHSIKRR